MHPLRVHVPTLSPGGIAQKLVRHPQSAESAQAAPNCEDGEQSLALLAEPPSLEGGTSATQLAPRTFV